MTTYTAEKEMTAASSQLELATPTPSERQQHDIVVVDDEKHITDLITEALEDEGYQVRVLHDGASALAEIARTQPKLVLLDIAMPVMFGDEVLRQLRAAGLNSIPVIIMTAGLGPQRYLKQGANDILPKPFALDALMAKVAHYLPATP